jgi:outer membrane protein OmpA-like peptidoglycan-associated protein
MMAMLFVARPVALVAAFLLAGDASAIADCAKLIDQFNTVLQARDLPEVKAIEAQIVVDAGCGGRLVEVQRRRAALQLLVAQQQQGSPSQYEMLVVDADKPDVLWRAAVALGDLRFKQRRFGEATQAYERALETLKDQSKTPTAPSSSDIREIFDSAVKSRMLAANDESPTAIFVTAGKDHRDGKLGGTMSRDIRGFKPTSVPLPIRFVTASAKFTTVGEQAAKELITALREQESSQVTLIGHTDERGAPDYNMNLSAERAKAVAAYLRDGGITAKVVTVAKGKTEPLVLSNSSGLTRDDIWALNRRVVWKRD